MISVFAILLTGFLLSAGAAAAQTVPATGQLNPTQAQARRALEVLEDPAKQQQLIDTLRAIAATAPAAPEPPAPSTALEPNSLGALLLTQLSEWGDRLSADTAATAKVLSDLPLVWLRVERALSTPAFQRAFLTALGQLVVILGVAWLAEWLAWSALGRPIAAVAAHSPENGSPIPGGGPRSRAWRLSRRLPFAAMRLLLELIPIAVVAGIGNLLAAILSVGTIRLAMLTVVNAYVAYRVVLAVGMMMTSPRLERLRLFDIDDAGANYLIAWLRRITAIAVFGTAVAQICQLLGLDPGIGRVLLRLVGLIVAGLLVFLVMRNQNRVAAYIRGAPTQASVNRWRGAVAATWHYLALIVIAAAWFVWVSGQRNATSGLRLIIGTVVVLVLARLAAIVALGALDRMAHLGSGLARFYPGLQPRAPRYQASARLSLILLIDFTAFLTLLELWGVNAFLWFAPGRVGGHLLSALVTITIAVVAAALVWEGANAMLERYLARLGEAGPAVHAARLRTLLPMLRAALFAAIIIVVGLTALSQIGVNIAPLLAGAGVIGVAIGFGAQKLVQDVITGMFVLFENAIQVGDTVTVAALTGTVERLSMRTIWLRGGDGAMHVIPFNAVTTITNTSRGLGTAAVAVTVAFWENSDRVAAVLREIAEELRDEPEFTPLILSDLKLLGVDAVTASGVKIAVEIPCTAAGRWPVQREFNRRLQKRFQELGITLSSG